MRGTPDPNCPHCNGTGHIYLDGLTFRRCKCLLRSLYAAKLGRLFKYKTAKKSPLLKRLDSNLFMVISDDDVGPHLKAAFIKLGLEARWAYVTDSDVLQAWLGQSNSVGATNLHDLSEYPFLVLRLGVQGYSNKALSGVLSELLQARALKYLPTWIISPRALTPDCLEYSDELDGLIRRFYSSNSFKRRSNEDSRPEAPHSNVIDMAPLTAPKKKRQSKMNALSNANDILRNTMKRG